MISRRVFIQILAGGVLCAPLAAEAQPAGKIYRVGVLSGGSAAANPQIQAFREGLQALGWVEGRNIAIESRFADGRMDRLASLAADLVRLDVQVIVAWSRRNVILWALTPTMRAGWSSTSSAVEKRHTP